LLVSGYEFYILSKRSFCPRYPEKKEHIEEGDLVFVNLDSFSELLKNLPENKFRLITHNSDNKFTEYHYNLIKDKVSKIYAINCIIKNDFIQKIPLGFVDTFYKPHENLKKIEEEKNTKSIFVYMNFSINTNINERTNCFNTFSNEKWVTKEQNLATLDFYRQLSKSQYSLSPEGTGIDCHRVYESLLFDTIPVIKSGLLDDFYSKLPILIVKDWSEVSENFLKENYEVFKNKLKYWKINYPNWHTAEFWLT